MDTELKNSWQFFFRITNRMRHFAVRQSGGINAMNGKIERLSGAQERVVDIVLSHPEGIMIKDIAWELGLTSPAVSQTVDSLVREGLLVRTASESDRRVTIIQPSESHRRLQKANGKYHDSVMESALNSVSPKERSTFLKVLKLIDLSFADFQDAESIGKKHQACHSFMRRERK